MNVTLLNVRGQCCQPPQRSRLLMSLVQSAAMSSKVNVATGRHQMPYNTAAAPSNASLVPWTTGIECQRQDAVAGPFAAKQDRISKGGIPS